MTLHVCSFKGLQGNLWISVVKDLGMYIFFSSIFVANQTTCCSPHTMLPPCMRQLAAMVACLCLISVEPITRHLLLKSIFTEAMGSDELLHHLALTKTEDACLYQHINLLSAKSVCVIWLISKVNRVFPTITILYMCSWAK